jgi:Aminotransferase class-V
LGHGADGMIGYEVVSRTPCPKDVSDNAWALVARWLLRSQTLRLSHGLFSEVLVMSNEAHAGTQAGKDTDREKIARIRAELPVTQRYRYFNTGTNGPLPQRSHDALVANAQMELSEGRIRQAGFMNLLQNLSDTRAAVAQLLRCDASEIALTRNTTEGMNIAVMGLSWQTGDEVITSTTEHPGGLYPVYLLHRRYGVTIRITQIGMPSHDPIEDVAQRSVRARRRSSSRMSIGRPGWSFQCASWPISRTMWARCSSVTPRRPPG